ncbi:hypothetical protein Cme02nite_38080 [Catellatospora methionotrophica]|uniref:Uncharacterized protein n=1 Tax=Catellatospora methionotrophica TaxID=121620 RepID=A0A8J3PHM0_9ACTN|nr:hypothetical protein [Catellatospora methionotrophica]GIG15476.1 hypothetical protein Cme02nite_38080 [Catellatospora methionotrophica]
MTFAPETIQAARRLKIQHLDVHPTSKSYPNDLDPDEVGIVGDTAHAAKGTSYHLGKDQLTADAYSRRTARDKAGLSNAASAEDVGEFRIATPLGTFDLRHYTAWLFAQCRASAPDTLDLREVIGTVDGKTVLRWDAERGRASAPRSGEADSSHLWHTHKSWYRDSENRDASKAKLDERYLREIGLIEGDEDMTPDQDRKLTALYNGIYGGGPSCGEAVDPENVVNAEPDPKTGKRSAVAQAAFDFQNGHFSQLKQIRANQAKILTALGTSDRGGMTPEKLAELGVDVARRLGTLTFVADTDGPTL